MKIMLLLAVFSGVAVSAESEPPMRPDVLGSGNKFEESSALKVSKVSLLSESYRYETEFGQKDGVSYSIDRHTSTGTVDSDYFDASEKYQIAKSWSVSCSRDAMTDRLSCLLSRGDLYVFFDGKSYKVDVGNDHFPGNSSSIRVGSGKPLTTKNENGSFPRDVSARIVSMMRSSDSVSTRYVKWPYDVYQDKKLSLKGFPVALDLMSWMYRSHK